MSTTIREIHQDHERQSDENGCLSGIGEISGLGYAKILHHQRLIMLKRIHELEIDHNEQEPQ